MLVKLAKGLGLHRSRTLYYVYHKYLCKDPHPLNTPRHDVVLKTDGQKFLVSNPTESNIGRAIFDHGVWEPEATRLICPRVRLGMTVVDVGAHTGYYTILFAKRVGPHGRVIAFEPEERGLAFMDRNLKMNRHRNVTVLPVALSDRVGALSEREKAYYVADDAVNSTAREPGPAVRVFDDLVESLDIQRLDLVKIDVEGAELHVLEGMLRSLVRWSPDILLEVHPAHLENCGRSEAQLHSFLDELGYPRQHVSGPSRSGVYTVFCRPRARELATSPQAALCTA